MNDIGERVNDAVETLLANDAELLINDTNERTSTERLATYVKPLFEG